MKITVRVDGREASPDHLGNAVEDAIVTKVKEQMTQKLSNLRCPEHDQVPTLEFEGSSMKGMKIRIRACCDYMRQEAEQALNQK